MIEQRVVEAVRILQESKDPGTKAKEMFIASGLMVAKLNGLQDVSLTLNEILSTVNRFSEDEKKALAKEGLTSIYFLAGKPLREQIKENHFFKQFWDFTRVENLLTTPSMLTEVAIDARPHNFFLQNSFGATRNQQVEMIDEYSDRLQRILRTQSVKAVLGEAPDYTQLAFLHRDTTGDHLFGRKYGFSYTRTMTPVFRDHTVIVGRFGSITGMRVYYWRLRGHSRIGAVPLVVPASFI